jgi:hypothetical protein
MSRLRHEIEECFPVGARVLTPAGPGTVRCAGRLYALVALDRPVRAQRFGRIRHALRLPPPKPGFHEWSIAADRLVPLS